MDFSLSDEQLALRAMARDLFADVSPAAHLRELWNGAEPDDRAWRAMAEVGLTGLGISEEHSGSGGDAVDVMLVVHEAGRACVADPVIETVAIAGAVFGACENAAIRDYWLPRVAAGEATVAVQVADQPYVAGAGTADALLVEVDGGLHLLERDGFTATPVEGEDRGRPLFRVEYEAGRRVGAAVIAHRWGALGAAAMLNGISEALLDMTLAYVKVRQQFGVPVGSFQAVKHKLASMYASLGSATAATQLAAYAVAVGATEQDHAVSVAKVHAVEAERLANAEALQCHGGIGFTWEHDLHFWLKRGRAVEHVYGSAAEHRRRIAAALLDD